MRLVVQLVGSKVVCDVLVKEDVVWAVVGRVEFGGAKLCRLMSWSASASINRYCLPVKS